MKKKKKKEPSLRIGLIGIVASCWIFPMLLIINIFTYSTSSGIKRRFDEAVAASVSNVGSIVRSTLQHAVTVSRYASYEGSIYNAYLNYKKNGNEQRLFDDVNGFLVKQYRFDDNILAAIMFFLDDTERLYETHNQSFSSPYANIIEYRQNVHEEVIRIAKTLDTRIEFFVYNESGGLYMIRNIVDKEYVPFSVLVLKLNTENVYGAFESVAWQTGVALYLNDALVEPLGDGWSKPIGKPDKFTIESGGFKIKSQNGVSIFAGRESIDGVDMLYVVEVDGQSILGGLNSFAGLFSMLLATLVPLLAFAVWYFYRHIFNPIAVLSSAARDIQNGQLGMSIGVNMPNREFQYLNKSFNRMSVKLKQQFERLYSEELALRDARIMALQSEINPHFLNNTLEIINWEARLGNNAKVSRMIEALSTMLDAATDRKGLPLIPLSRELMYLDAYLYIISERFGKRLIVKKEIDADLLHFEVPRLIMQPITENAVEHGVSALQRGEIIIRARRNTESGEILLEVENNKALSIQDKENIVRLLSPDYDMGSLQLGIHNVNMRLKIIYGGSAGLSITGSESNTVSKISIPDLPDFKIGNNTQ